MYFQLVMLCTRISIEHRVAKNSNNFNLGTNSIFYLSYELHIFLLS